MMRPQQRTAPDAVSKHACDKPAASAMMHSSTVGTANWPYPLPPQHWTVFGVGIPIPTTAHTKSPPATNREALSVAGGDWRLQSPPTHATVRL